MLHVVGLLLVFERTLLALVTDIYGYTYSLVGYVVVRIVFKLVKSSFNKKKKTIGTYEFSYYWRDSHEKFLFYVHNYVICTT